MSGYLQRLVQTAAQPVQRVHPFAGSIFASSHEDQTSGIESEEIVVATSAINPMVGLTSNPTVGSTSQQPNVPQQNARPDGVRLRDFVAIAPAGTVTSFRTGDETNAPLLQEGQFVQPRRTASNIEETEPDRLPSAVALSTEFHPLMPPEAAVAEPRLAPVRPLAKGRAPSDNRSTAAAQTNDDIQIHIGRIEVTAVHPPAPRTAKALDRGPSLDAYLNRRAR
jgi:hypothetical protein